MLTQPERRILKRLVEQSLEHHVASVLTVESMAAHVTKAVTIQSALTSLPEDRQEAAQEVINEVILDTHYKLINGESRYASFEDTTGE